MANTFGNTGWKGIGLPVKRCNTENVKSVIWKKDRKRTYFAEVRDGRHRAHLLTELSRRPGEGSREERNMRKAIGCDQKYLDISKITFEQGLESGLLYVSLTEAGESLARLSPDAPIFDGPHGNEILKNSAFCAMLLVDDIFYAKLKASGATIEDIYVTFVVSEIQPPNLKMFVEPLFKRYIIFHCPYPSDEKTLKKFLDSNGITPRNYSDAELASIHYDRGYEKPPVPNAEKTNEKK